MIIKLERLNDREGTPFSPPRYLHLNIDRIESWHAGSQDGITSLRMASGQTYVVAIIADELHATIDPDGYCPQGGPPVCGYHDYLGRRDADEAGDLSHAGYHAAASAAERHFTGDHGGNGICTLCISHERRMRA